VEERRLHPVEELRLEHCARRADCTTVEERRFQRRVSRSQTTALARAFPMVYTNGIYHEKLPMPKTGIAKLFRNGRSQAVRLPRDFRLEGDQVRVRRVSQGVLLEPLISDPRQWFAELDRLNGKSFMRKARNQPMAPRRDIFK